MKPTDATKVSAPTKTTWVTKDGERIPVREMNDSHLVNTIQYLRRIAQIQLIESTLAIGQYLSDDPPDGAWLAVIAAEHDLNDMNADEFALEAYPTFAAMLKEAEQRGLDAATSTSAGGAGEW